EFDSVSNRLLLRLRTTWRDEGFHGRTMPDKDSRARHRRISRFFPCHALVPRGVVREEERAARRYLRGPLEDTPLQIAGPGGSDESSSRRVKHSFFVSFLFRPALVVAQVFMCPLESVAWLASTPISLHSQISSS